MVAKKIQSLQHPLIKHWTRLRKERTVREEFKQVLVAGKKAISELAIETLIFSRPHSLKVKEQIEVTDEILCKITGLNSTDGFAAIVKMPQVSELSSCNYLVIFNEISDPGNLGTLIRTALALSWQGAILTPNTVDLFNEKTVRASKGAVFKLPFAYKSLSELASEKRRLYTADLKGASLDELKAKTPLGLILSHEGRGPGENVEHISEKITIPMSDEIESLGVASAGSILLYAMRP